MSKKRKSAHETMQQLFEEMGELLKEVAGAMAKKKNVSTQLLTLSECLEDVDSKAKRIDKNASVRWLSCLSREAGIAAKIIDKFENRKVDVATVRLEVIDALAESTENISQSFINVSSALTVSGKWDLTEKQIAEIKAESQPLKKAMKYFAADLYATSFGLRMFTGLEPDFKSGISPYEEICGCCDEKDSGDSIDDTDFLNLENGVTSELGGKGEDLNEYISALEKDYERLKDLIKLLALYFIWLASRGYLITNAGGPPCDDECTPSANVVGTRVTNVTANLVQGAVLLYQPTCDVIWDYCCTNMCLVFYEENFIKSVTTGPHKLGGQVRLVNGQNARAAQLVANRRAATFRPINKLTPPVKPSC